MCNQGVEHGHSENYTFTKVLKKTGKYPFYKVLN
jgi:hypothetical protein